MSSLSEELTPSEAVQPNITDVTEDRNEATEDCNVVDDVTNELIESKSGRKIKPSRKMYEKYEDRKKKSKPKGTKGSKRPSNVALVELDDVVDKTPAVEIPPSTPAVCGYCHKGHQDDPLESGKMFSISGVTTHYFCMLFTYNSSQLGADSEGLFGFYGDEVKKQIEGGKKKCKYCGKRGATARCNKKHCGVYMHFPCGQEAGATFQFMGKMHTYCFMHRVKQKVETFPTPPDTDCVICYEKVDQVLENFKKIRAPCCGRHFHRDCVQRFAMTSGTQHFKCPNCNNQEEITKEFKKKGVYIPYKDAEWELPGQQDFYNWKDHYVQTKRCCAKECLCKEEEGRSFNEFENEIILCDMCGTNGVHMKCGNIDEDTLDYACVDCGGDVALLERTNDSRNSSMASSSFNLSLASTVDDSLADSSASTVDDSFNSDKDASTTSMPNIRDFIKQFEITPSVTAQDSLMKNSESGSSLTSTFTVAEQSLSEISEEVVSKRPHKKRGPKSKTQPIISTPSPTPVIQAPVEDSSSKHNFFKHTEEVTKMLEDLKRKEQENKSKDAFFKSLTAAQASEKKETLPDSLEASLDFKNYLAKSLGKEDPNQVVPATPSAGLDGKFEDIHSKINDLTKTIGLPDLDAFTFESPAKTPPPAGMLRTIKVRTDLLAGTDLFDSNNVMETAVTLSEETAIESTEDDDISLEGIEISEKKRAFGSFLLTRQKSKVSCKTSSYIEYFYQHMDKSDAAVKKVEENMTANTEPSVSNILEDSIDVGDENDEITLNEMNEDDIPEETVADTSLGLEIVDTFTCTDSFIDELLNSPVKSPGEKVSDGHKEATPPEDEETVDNNDAPGTNLIDVETATTLASPLTKSKEEESKEAAVEPVKAVVSKPRAGPRSRTKPTEPPVQRTSPSKIKESIAENIKIFEEQAKALKSKPLAPEQVQSKPAVDRDIVQEASKKKSDELVEDTEKSNDKEPETIKYRPGPKSRKKYLVVKEDEVKKQEPNEKTKLISSPKRSSESPDVHVAKKQKTEEVVNLDSTISSDESHLEIIDLDGSDDTSASDLTKLDTSTKDIIKEVTDLLGPPKENKKVEEISTTVEKESSPTEEAIVEISKPSATPSATTAAVSKRASKRPFQCPVCQGFFRSEMVLQQHLAKIHFWNRLLALPKEATTASGPVFQCSEFPCRYIHKSQTIVAGHLATEHKVVFKIALNIFPDFKLPILPPTTSSDPSITILASVPGRLPPVSTLQTEYPSKRSLSLPRPEDEQNKKPKQLPSQSVRPVILPSQPHKAVARVKPRTAPVQPTVQAPQSVEAPLKPVNPALPLPGQEYFLQKSLQSSYYNC